MRETLSVALLAFGVVILAMGALTAVVYLTRVAARWSAARNRGTGTAAPEGVEEETLVLISAAAYQALRKPLRIHRIHLHREPSAETWSRAGRMDILISHQHVGRHQ